MSKFYHDSHNKKRPITPEQADLERRIDDMEVKNKQDMEVLHKKIARIRTKLR